MAACSVSEETKENTLFEKKLADEQRESLSLERDPTAGPSQLEVGKQNSCIYLDYFFLFPSQLFPLVFVVVLPSPPPKSLCHMLEQERDGQHESLASMKKHLHELKEGSQVVRQLKEEEMRLVKDLSFSMAIGA